VGKVERAAAVRSTVGQATHQAVEDITGRKNVREDRP